MNEMSCTNLFFQKLLNLISTNVQQNQKVEDQQRSWYISVKMVQIYYQMQVLNEVVVY